MASEERYVPSPPPPPEELRIVHHTIEVPSPPVEVFVEAPPPEVIVVAPAAPATPPADEYRPPPVADPPASRRSDGYRGKPHEPVQLAAAGTVIPSQLYGKWFSDFHAVDRNAAISYQAIGSSAGIRQMLQRSGQVDMASADVPLTNQEASAGRVYLHFPTAIMGVAVICNIDGQRRELALSAELLADIYLGHVTQWGDSAIRALNPGVALPYARIVPVHRADPTSSTSLFTEYLSTRSAEWKSRAGTGATVRWPESGPGGKGDEGVAGLVTQTPGAIGYVTVPYVLQNKLSPVALRNVSGAFVKPELASLTAAAAQNETIPGDFRVSSLASTSAAKGYPVAGFFFLILPDRVDDSKREAARWFLRWMLADGQSSVASFGLAPLPTDFAAKVQSQIRKLH